MDEPLGLRPGDQTLLLRLARHALEARVRGQRAPVPPRGGPLDLARAVFVSLHVRDDGALRGCVGRLDAAPLAPAVAGLAAAVADSDPRFPPVLEPELGRLVVEISVLTPARAIAPGDLVAGRHGVIVESGACRGLLLPQVALEHGWGSRRLLEQACLKAGLRTDAWQTGARVLAFEAEVFGEQARLPTR